MQLYDIICSSEAIWNGGNIFMKIDDQRGLWAIKEEMEDWQVRERVLLMNWIIFLGRGNERFVSLISSFNPNRVSTIL